MEVLKRKILLEDSIDRNANSPTWGTMTATTFYLNIPINQSIDDMGLFLDILYIPKSTDPLSQPDYTLLEDKLYDLGLLFPFMTGATSPTMTGITGTTEIVLRMPNSIETDYYDYGNLKITGYTESKIDNVKSYDAANKYRTGFNMATSTYDNYEDPSISVLGVNRIKTMANPRIYVFDTLDDTNLGTPNQTYGLQYIEYTGDNRTVIIDNVTTQIPFTEFNYIGEGWNKTNTSLSALTKEEYLFGIISPPEVQSDVFIERGVTSVMDMHLRLSEIKDLGELSRYGNGFYKLNKQ